MNGGRFSAGHEVGGYTLMSRLDSGGQGEVWDASSPAGPVALKLLHPEQSGTRGEARARFRKELRAAQQIRSICVARPVDADLDGETAWIAYERITGSPLSAYLRDHEVQVPLGEALHILAEVAEGLVAVHEQGLTHCDLKPANVMVRPRGGAVLLDLGAVAFGDNSDLTRAGFGTDGWRAPEQGFGDITTASDMYAFGLLAIRVLTGHLAYAGQFRFGGDPDLRGVPVAVADLVLGCLEASAVRRPTAQEALDLVGELRERFESDRREHEQRQEQERQKKEAADAAARERAQRRGRPAPPPTRRASSSADWQSYWPVLTRLRAVHFTCSAVNGRIGMASELDPTPLWGHVLTRDQRVGGVVARDGQTAPLHLGDWYVLHGHQRDTAHRGEVVTGHVRYGSLPRAPFGRPTGPAVPLPDACPECGTALAWGAHRWSRDESTTELVCPSHTSCPPQLTWRAYQLVGALLGFEDAFKSPVEFEQVRSALTGAGVKRLPDLFDAQLPSILRRARGDAAELVAKALEAARTAPDLVVLLGLGLHRAQVFDPFEGMPGDFTSTRTLHEALRAWDLSEPDERVEPGYVDDSPRVLHVWALEDGGWRRETLQAAFALRGNVVVPESPEVYFRRAANPSAATAGES